MIKVLIVDEQKLLRESLKDLLEKHDDISVAGCAANGIEALQMCEDLKPDLVLMDINMPVYSGIDGMNLIKDLSSDIKVIILTANKDEDNIAEAISNGADGYILKDVSPEVLVSAIKSTMNGLHIMSDKPYRLLTGDLTYARYKRYDKKPLIIDEVMTDKEYQILCLIAEGKNNRDIAA